MRPWLQDPDGDGTYTWSTDQIPAGNYEFKVAHGLSWDENYGDGGAPNGANVAVPVPSDGTRRHHLATSWPPTQITRRRPRGAGSAPDLTKAKARLGRPRPRRLAGRVGARGHRPGDLPRGGCTGRPTGGLAVDAEAVTGGSTANLSRDAAGLPAAVVAAHPRAQGLPGPAAVAEHRPAGRVSCAVRWPWGCTTPSAG